MPGALVDASVPPYRPGCDDILPGGFDVEAICLGVEVFSSSESRVPDHGVRRSLSLLPIPGGQFTQLRGFVFHGASLALLCVAAYR